MSGSYIDSLLGEREKILLISRQHWFTLVSSIVLEIVIFIVILVAGSALAIAYPSLSVVALVVGILILLVPLITMVMDILNWTNRQYIITNRRVMQISGVVNKNVIDSSLEKVNDIKMVQSVFGRIFDYGDVEILTASELGANKFRRIARPIHFKTTMLNAKEKLDRISDPESVVAEDADQIIELIAKLGELREKGAISEEEFNQKKADLLSKM